MLNGRLSLSRDLQLLETKSPISTLSRLSKRFVKIDLLPDSQRFRQK